MKAVLVGGALLALAGGASLKELNVSQPERDVLSGKVIYSTICIPCHGVEGKGDGQMKFTPPVADLTSPAVQGKLDARLFKSVHDGKSNTAMEPGGKHSQTMRFGMRSPMCERWLLNEPVAWAAGFDEIG